MYYIWRRSDGFTNASMAMPSDWTQPSDGKRVTFKKLGEFETWLDARAFLMKYKIKGGKAPAENSLASRLE